MKTGIPRETKVERLRRLEEAAKPLIEQCEEPQQKGKIYQILARTYANSAITLFPNKAAEYAEKAINCPCDPVQKMDLYVTWGDAIQVAHAGVRGRQLAQVRKEAIKPYLLGLKETVKHNLPEEKPELPSAGFYNYTGPTDSVEYQKMKAEHEKLVAAREQAEFLESMIQRRDTLTGQISFMYSRMPFANDELEKMATEILQDKACVDRLMSHVKGRVQKRIDAMGGNVNELPQNLMDTQTSPATTTPVAVTRVAAPSSEVVPLATRNDSTSTSPGGMGRKEQAPNEQFNWLLPVSAALGVILVGIFIGALVKKGRRNVGR